MRGDSEPISLIIGPELGPDCRPYLEPHCGLDIGPHLEKTMGKESPILGGGIQPENLHVINSNFFEMNFGDGANILAMTPHLGFK